ncbi:MAG TPA: VOC family protein [Pseudonocardiaceae bacterium]
MLEVVMLPVADIDRAKEFYAGTLGFPVDHDTRIPGGPEFVQLTPPGSGCSIVLSRGMADMAPGTQRGVQLVVADIRAAHAYLRERGVECGEVVVYGPQGPRPATEDETGTTLDNVGFVNFTDPDGNAWAVQQISARGA